MKVHNLTDVKTPVLEQRGLFNQDIIVGTRMCAAGESVEVGDNEVDQLKAHLEHFIKYGAIAFGEPPEEYTKMKDAVQHANAAKEKAVESQRAEKKPSLRPHPEINDENDKRRG